MHYNTLFAVIVISASALHIELIVASTEDSQRYIDFVGEDGVTQTIDTEAEPQSNTESETDTNKYHLFTRLNRNDSQILVNGDEDSIKNSNFNPSLVTVFIVPGWFSAITSEINGAIREPILDTSDVNVINVDWRPYSRFDYITATSVVPMICSRIAKFIEFLVNVTSASYSKIHLIGNSLGAHVVGCTGANLGGKIPRITATDPASPLWEDRSDKLNVTNAIYVEVIHTDGPGFGLRTRMGNTDFYPNGGAVQPGCFLDYPPCSHRRGWQLYAASVKYVFVGHQCASLEDMDSNSCDGPTLVMGNTDITKTGSGIYRLETTSEYPYQ